MEFVGLMGNHTNHIMYIHIYIYIHKSVCVVCGCGCTSYVIIVLLTLIQKKTIILSSLQKLKRNC